MNTKWQCFLSKCTDQIQKYVNEHFKEFSKYKLIKDDINLIGFKANDLQDNMLAVFKIRGFTDEFECKWDVLKDKFFLKDIEKPNEIYLGSGK